MNEESAQDTLDFITKRLSAIKSQKGTGELEDLALVIGKNFELIKFLKLMMSRREKSGFCSAERHVESVS